MSLAQGSQSFPEMRSEIYTVVGRMCVTYEARSIWCMSPQVLCHLSSSSLSFVEHMIGVLEIRFTFSQGINNF